MKNTVGVLSPVLLLLHAAFLLFATHAKDGSQHRRQVSVTSREVSMHCYQVAYPTAVQEEAVGQCQHCCSQYLGSGSLLDICRSHCLAAATAPTTTTTTATTTTTGESWAPREAMRYCYHYATLLAHPDPRQTCQDCCARYLPAGCPSLCQDLATSTTTATILTATTTAVPAAATQTAVPDIGRRRQIAWTFGSASAATTYCYRWSGLFPYNDPLGHCRTCCGQYLRVWEQLLACYTRCEEGYAPTTTTTPLPTTVPSATAAAAKRLLPVPDSDAHSRLTVCVDSAALVSGDATLQLRTCHACCDDTSRDPLLALLPAMRTACRHECDALVHPLAPA